MATDLFGKATSPRKYELTAHQRHQATLLHYWTSLTYLERLLDMVTALIAGADLRLLLATKQGRDEIFTNPRWGARDTPSNWSTNAFPALLDFRQSVVRDISMRAYDAYRRTGAYNCGRMLGEFSSHWMTPEEERVFNNSWELVYRFAYRLDAVVCGPWQRPLNDFVMATNWPKNSHLFLKLPKFRVRTDIEGTTDFPPPKTGVYVAQDDPNATLQFAWNGHAEHYPAGDLIGSATFNQLGLRLLGEIGREALWLDDQAMRTSALRTMREFPDLDYGSTTLEEVDKYPELAASALCFSSFTTRPCKWFYVEAIEGEFEDDVAPASTTTTSTQNRRCPAGQPCPRTGYWFTPAKSGSRRMFQTGEIMPDLASDYGAVIWQFDGADH